MNILRQGLFLAVVGAAMVASATDVEQVVRQQYPTRLTTRLKPRDRDLLTHNVCWVVVAGNAATPTAIVAGYADGAVALLRSDSQGAWSTSALLTVDDSYDFVSDTCEANLVDVGAQHTRLTRVSFLSRLHSGADDISQDWYFRVSATQLQSVTPLRSDVGKFKISKMLNSGPFDIDNDGANEIVALDHKPDQDDDENAGQPDSYGIAYSLGPIGLQPVRVIRYLQSFTRSAEKPSKQRSSITLEASAVGTYRIHILNGSADGSNRAASAHVSINGREIAGPSDFNQQVAVIVREVTLDKENEIEVRIDSAPGSQIIIEAEPIQPAPSGT